MSDLGPLFAPRSIAVLGVSRSPAKLGYRLLDNVLAGGFAGRVFPVNPSGETILGVGSVPSVEALPEGIDLALVSLPAGAVPHAIEQLAARRVRAAVVLSSGFGEVGVEGKTTEAQLVARARAAGTRLVGPNCMGVYSAPARLNGTYFWDLPRATGGIGIVSQSGAYGGLIFRHLGSRGHGIARFVSIGNQVDVDVAEVLDYLADDDATTLVACFLEALRDGRRFVAAARRVTARKPVVVLKGGRSTAGVRAAGSHTGSLAGAFDLYRAAFDRAGVVLAEETEEFFDAVEALALCRHRPTRPNIAIITVSGGPSVAAADAAERAGLRVPALGAGVRTWVSELLPPFAALGNPIDLTPQVEPSRIAAAVDAVMADEGIAGAVAVNVGLDIPEFADALVAARTATGKPVVAFAADAPTVTARFAAAGIPVLPSPERAVRAWRALIERPAGRPLDVRPRASLPQAVRRALDTTSGALPYAAARTVLAAYGVRFCRDAIAPTVDAAIEAADRIGYPVVVKAEAAGLVHKTDVGAVRLDVRDGRAVRDACETIREGTGATAFVVQERVPAGVELLIGAKQDACFGPLVVLGWGGVLTEVIADVSFRLAPLETGDADRMLDEGLRPRLLAGPRGLPPVERSAVTAVLEAIGHAIVAEPRILEIDVNPVIAAGADVVAVDALIIAGDSPSPKESRP